MRSSISMEKGARDVLQREWSRVRREKRVMYIDDPLLCFRIRDIVEDGPPAYRHLLLANTLGKVTSPEVNYRKIYATQTTDDEYSPQRWIVDIIGPWEKTIGNRIGTAEDPPCDLSVSTQENLIIETRNADLEEQRLASVLIRLENEVNAGRISPHHVLREVLLVLTFLPANLNDQTQTKTTPV